jgi:hypothetical protein
VTLRLHGDHEGVRVFVGARDIPLAALDVPVPVDPGEVRVVARRDGEQVASSTVRIGGDAGLSAEVVLEIPPRTDTASNAVAPVVIAAPALLTPAEADAPSPILSSSRDRQDDSDGGAGLLGQWWFWTAIGVVGAGAVVAVIALSAGGTEPADLSVVRGDFDPGLLEGRVQ